MLRKTCFVGLALTSLLGYSLQAWAQEAASEKKEARSTTDDQPRKVARKLKVFKLQHSKPSEMAQLFAARHTVDYGFRGPGISAAPATAVSAATDAASPGRSAANATATAGSDQAASVSALPIHTAHDDEKRLLFVRGSEDQIKLIEKLVKAFDMPAAKLEKQKWEDLHLIPVRGAEAGNIQSILSQLGLSTHAVQLGDASVIVLQDSDDEEADQILEILEELDSADDDRKTTETTTTENTTTETRERR